MKTQARKPYAAPLLTDFGHVQALTASIKLVGASDGVGQLTPAPMEGGGGGGGGGSGDAGS